MTTNENGVYLGDARGLYGATPEKCPRCSSAMHPRILFGRVIGWRCGECAPNIVPSCYSVRGQGR